MRRTELALFTAVFVIVSSLALATGTQGTGRENGTFPDRHFLLTKGYFEKGDKGFYEADIAPTENCSWWVQLEILDGSAVKVEVYEMAGQSAMNLARTRLTETGQESDQVSLIAGHSYVASFSYIGKAGVAVLFERIAVSQTGYEVHGPILITSDARFTAENGVVSGSGAATDPYVIRDWSISTTTTSCIEIRDTTAHFEIRHVFVTSTRANATSLVNVNYGDILDSTFTGSYVGILMENCGNVSIARCGFSYDVTDFRASSSGLFELRDSNLRGSDTGIGMEHCHDFAVVGCSVESDSALCWLDGCDHGMFVGNSLTLTDVLGMGLYLMESPYMTLYSNQIHNSSVLIAALWNIGSSFDTHAIPTNNTANGKPILYQVAMNGVSLDRSDYGEVILVGCQGVKVSNMTFSNDFGAVQVAFSDDVVVCDNSFRLCSDGVSIQTCTNVQVCRNVFTNITSRAIGFWDSTGAVVQGNVISAAGNEQYVTPVTFVRVSSLEFVDNVITDCSWGEAVDFFVATSCTIAGNDISNVGGTALWLYLVVDLTVRENVISTCEMGIEVYGDAPARIYHNDFIDNLLQASDAGGNAIQWDNGYLDGGNFWSDYTGIDSDGDGFGDTPYVISDTASDMYPLMAPYNV